MKTLVVALEFTPVQILTGKSVENRVSHALWIVFGCLAMNAGIFIPHAESRAPGPMPSITAARVSATTLAAQQIAPGLYPEAVDERRRTQAAQRSKYSGSRMKM
jgi:hypothetical protein